MNFILKNNLRFTKNLLIGLVIACISIFNISAQEDDSKIITSYNNYTNSPREVAYLQLNKSTYIKGEDIGFTAYAFDKKTKEISKITTNLYVIIENGNKEIIKQKLLNLKNGIASNTFELDSTFTSGYYVIKAYTNWMRNFNEQDYFMESIRVIDPKVETQIEASVINSTIDAQFLPESGHLVDQISNTIGVVLKDQNGFGVPNAKGKVYDKNNLLVSEFYVNHLGIGRFLLLAEHGNDYTIIVNYLNKDYSFNLNETIVPVGVVINAVESKNKTFITLSTNQQSLNHLKDKIYTLTLHNGDGIYAQKVIFKESTSLVKLYDLKSMPTGINIFTLFNQDNKPVAERLFFNYNGLDKLESQAVTAKTVNDSINLKINFNSINSNKFNTLSVSILPADTECYHRHNNILSQTFLQPYVKGQIENSKYYFSKINNKTKFDMDNLLLTQGWSSYSWRDIFNKPSTFLFPFEQGITIKANISNDNTKNTEAYMVNINRANNPLIIKLEKDQKHFVLNNIFLEKDQSIYITELSRNSGLKIPNLYIQSFPNKIPSLDENKYALKPKHDYITLTYLKKDNIKTDSFDKTQKLDEVLVSGKKDNIKIRTNELNKRSFRNNVKVITDEDRKSFFTLEEYMRVKGGVTVNETRSVRSNNPNSGISFYTGTSISPNSSELMDIFVDDTYFGQSIAPRYFLMNNVDYIEINKTGLGTGAGQGFKGTGGVIRIYTNPKQIAKSPSKKRNQEYKLPLNFSTNKKFYVPKYKYYNDDFYLKYGTVAWKPQIISNEEGSFDFNIFNTKIPLTLFIEGIANDGSFIFEEKTISLN